MKSILNIKRLAILFAVSGYLLAADPIFLRRQVSEVKPQPDDLTAANAKAASYKPLFGIGDQDADQLKGVARYGELTVEPGGTSAMVSYPAEEQIYFIEEGSGTLLYGDETAPVRKNDFMYLPVGVRHGIANGSNAPVKAIVMGYRIPADIKVQPTPKLMLANAEDVHLQILGQHGPTSQFKLMMGTTSSQRDKLAAAYLMDSLFIMDFAPGGTNIPHNHPAEEEIYFLARGSGDMVAGLDANGKEARHPVTEGAAFFFKPGTEVGYYSNAKEGQPHDLMLAVRSRVPGMSMRGPGGRGGAGRPADQPAQYSVERDGDAVRLLDGKSQTVVSVMPSRGNSAFDMRVRGKKVLQDPYASPEEYKKSRGMTGIPFLAPWANRLDTTGFYANGKKYNFNLDLGTMRRPPDSHPSHGFLSTATDWEVVEAKADRNAAWVTSRLEFYRHPDWMAQFPFAHTIEMTYRLKDGTLEVQTRLNNLSVDPMPVAIGFHPFFQVNDAPRDEWTFGLGARTQWMLAPDKIPTGETRPIEQFLPDPRHSALKGLDLDHVFGDLVRDDSGKATMWVQGKTERVEVAFGPNYHAVVVYAPAGPNRNFICFEPMAAITDALNLAQRGVYKELQYIPPGKTWQESFWVRPSGF